MRMIKTVVLAGFVGLTAGCTDFLAVNDNPNAPGPEVLPPNLFLPPLVHWMNMSAQWDGRFIGRYTQQWQLLTTGTLPSTWDRMGYDPNSDNGGQIWRDVYWTLGQNLIDMMDKSEAEERWDMLGIGHAIKAWGWYAATAVHGEIIIQEAFNTDQVTFPYDTQEFAYQEALRHLDEAFANLARTDGSVDPVYVARGDRMYNGDREKWLKFAWGLRALTLNHFTNKTSYDPAAVIAAVDNSFSSNADDALLAYPATQNDDTNFWGRTRGNMNSYRQTRFTLELMDGTQFGGAEDPRMTRMLAPSPDGVYRGTDPNIGTGGIPAAQMPNNLHGYAGSGGTGSPGRYLFDDRTKLPTMTYAQLQFVKAEAALRMGNRPMALEAYVNGINAHIDFVNARTTDIAGGSATPVTAAERAAFLASPEIVPAAADLTLSHIMMQKYIAQWGWAHIEIWMDMRRFNYTDLDPDTGEQVFRGFAIPTNLYPNNSGKVVHRLRPRYNSEYVWNQVGLEPIGGLLLDYHTKPMWITER